MAVKQGVLQGLDAWGPILAFPLVTLFTPRKLHNCYFSVSSRFEKTPWRIMVSVSEGCGEEEVN